MTRTKRKRMTWVLLFGILTILWGVRYVTFNKEILAIKEPAHIIKYEDVGEWAEFGENYVGDNYMKGYSIRIKNVRYVSPEAYAREVMGMEYHSDIVQDQMTTVCEVEVEIKNEQNTDTGIDLLSTFLTGPDFYAGIWLECFDAVNGFEENTFGGIRLHTDSECTLKLPYLFWNHLYREKAGRKLENEAMWLTLTGYPEKVWVRVQ